MKHLLPKPRIAVIIAAAGKGERLGGDVPKAWRDLCGTTLLERSIASFQPPSLQTHQQICHVTWMGLAVDSEYVQRARELTLSAQDPIEVVEGGATRVESVRNVLARVPDAIDVIAVHDAARPFWPVEKWDELVQEAWKWDGAILAIPVGDTLKRAEIAGMVTVDRHEVWAAQTPQAFRAEMLKRAHEQVSERDAIATDDAELVRRVRGAIKFVYSSPRNFKITTREDWKFAEQVATMDNAIRVGTGYDAHRLGSDGPLMIGGVRLADTGGLIGHSDGDVLLHAICDALLGATTLGDIGTHFPPSDERLKGIDSRHLLRETRVLLSNAGYQPSQIDATILAEAPRMAPHVDAMRMIIAEDLALSINDVSIKATTTEGMGFVGRGEGIAAQAVATITRSVT
ncbi:MAG: 2-C-methyl-D-erythritol 2,4-cyclodiphosphate synthase [candidate division Zixibacteria bacterium]|nr:2-C-methyl-D-erythritol 2,4-cyclodiphosphate synthase [candidate division Zixibacteria bacterium]